MYESLPAQSVSSATPLSSCKSISHWQPALDEPLRSQAFDTARMVAERLRNPDTVTSIAQLARQQSASFWDWSPSSIAAGFGSTALLFLFLARSLPDQGWEAVAQRHLRIAADFTHRHPLRMPGIFVGSSGLASVVSLFAQDNNRYYQAAHALDEHVAEQVLERQWKREQAVGVTYADYDVIAGAAGIVGYLVTLHQPGEQIQMAIQKLLEYLIWLAESDEADERKRWFIAPDFYPLEAHRQNYPDGYFDCGLAHGIPGPLAALTLAWRAGYHLPKQREAMDSLVHWMQERQLHDAWGINWPGKLPPQQSYPGNKQNTLPPCRTAWCYGVPGIARALWLSGTALGNVTLCQTAVEAIEHALQRPIAIQCISSVTYCHGTAGLLSTCLRFAHETNSEIVHRYIPLLVKHILDAFDPNHPLGFRDLEQEKTWVDDPGLLTGAAGVALTLLAASTPVEPDWDRIFLIA